MAGFLSSAVWRVVSNVTARVGCAKQATKIILSSFGAVRLPALSKHTNLCFIAGLTSSVDAQHQQLVSPCGCLSVHSRFLIQNLALQQNSRRRVSDAQEPRCANKSR